MRSDAWFVLFPSARAPDAEAVTATLKRLSQCILEPRDDRWILYSGEHPIEIGMTAAPHVLGEARVAVDQHAGALPAPVETYDARFELGYDGDRIDQLHNALSVAAARLAQLTGGIVYAAGAFRV